MVDKVLINLSSLTDTLRSMDIIANNIANASALGFKRQSVKFEEFFKRMPPGERETKPEIVSLVSGVGVVRDVNRGRVDKTGTPYDFAISGARILSCTRSQVTCGATANFMQPDAGEISRSGGIPT